jgi:hypothetical protein
MASSFSRPGISSTARFAIHYITSHIFVGHPWMRNRQRSPYPWAASPRTQLLHILLCLLAYGRWHSKQDVSTYPSGIEKNAVILWALHQATGATSRGVMLGFSNVDQTTSSLTSKFLTDLGREIQGLEHEQNGSQHHSKPKPTTQLIPSQS